jgi:TRAP transporter 4TM/12TM fusion protein
MGMVNMPEDSTGTKQKWERILSIALPIAAITMIIYQLTYTQYLLQDPIGHRITHLGFAFLIVLLSLILKSRRNWLLKWILLISALLVTGYLLYFLDPILEYRQSIPIPSDIVIGVIILILTFVTTYLIFGRTFPIITAIAVAYLVLGRYLPHPFTVAPVSVTRLLMWLSAGIGVEQGVYGGILGISANYLFLLVLFGSFLYAFNGIRFIIGIGQLVGSKCKGGPAMVAVIGSSLLGTMTGSTVANITITGTYTIPMMKKGGYSNSQAGAVEATASNGGQIVPPVMGAAAFLMASFTGIPYLQIAIASILPAVVYYLSLIFYVQITANKMNIEPLKDRVSVKKLMIDAPLFVLPLAILVFLLAQGYSLPFVGFWSIMSMVVLGVMDSFRTRTRPDFRQMMNSFVSGVRTACDVAIVCAVIGIFATCIEASGLGIKLPMLIGDLSYGNLTIALFITAVSSILLGMGVPTPAAYMLVAIGAAPALVSMGVSLLQAHLFTMIYAVFSHITPPVALGALVASKLAEADYWSTAWESLKAGASAFLLPFFIIYAPVLILRPDTGLVISVMQVVAILPIVFSLQTFLSNYCFVALRLDERILFGITTLLLLIGLITRGYPFFLAGIALFGTNIIRQHIRRKLIRMD